MSYKRLACLSFFVLLFTVCTATAAFSASFSFGIRIADEPECYQMTYWEPSVTGSGANGITWSGVYDAVSLKVYLSLGYPGNCTLEWTCNPDENAPGYSAANRPILHEWDIVTMTGVGRDYFENAQGGQGATWGTYNISLCP